jgi:hypothetical protein
MKKLVSILIFLLSVAATAQHAIETSFIKKEELRTTTIVSVDNFDNLFYINNNELFLQKKLEPISYSNIQLGEIASANAFNPLKINVFYKDFNTIVILDNRLAEIFRIDFNTIEAYRNVSHISTGNDNTLWLYNQDTNQLEVYDYLANKTRVQTLPIAETILDLKSNFNFCWLLTKNHLFVYNYFGSLISKTPNNGFTNLAENNGNIILKKENQLFYLKKNMSEITAIKLPKLLISQFLVTNETLYIYDGKILYQYQLKTN